MKTITFTIGGMHCASCSVRNEKSLKSIDGVTNAVVNFATRSAKVDYDESRTSEHEFHSVIKKNGYSVIAGTDHAHMHAESKKEHSITRNKAFISLILSVPVLILAMAGIRLPFELFGINGSTAVQGVLGSIIILGFGWEFHSGMVRQLRTVSANMDTLISLGTLAAWGYSAWMLVLGGDAFYFETGSIITALILLGRYFEALSRGRASAAIEKLLELGAKTAHRKKDGKEEDVAISDIKVGDILVVRPGEKIPTDGIIVAGETHIDESMLTGESMPIGKGMSDEVFGATMNIDGAVEMRATKVGSETVLAQIVKMVTEAQTTKAPIQKLADTISGIFVPIVIVIALATLLGWYWTTSDVSQSFLAAIAVLVIACPCALGLATPTALMVGTGTGAKRGILIKTGEALERAKKITIVLFDKTGTLTQGKPNVTDTHSVQPNISPDELLKIAGSLEHFSEHPLARAVVKECGKRNLTLYDVVKFTVLPGKGVQGTIESDEYFVGSVRFIKEQGILYEQWRSDMISLEQQGKTIICVIKKNLLIGYIGIADTLKEDAKEAVGNLQSHGITTMLVTGDNEGTAQAIANVLGIQKVYARVLPEEKHMIVAELQKKGEHVAFVGDGINDAPALVKAELGIAIGTGTDIAIEAGSIVLVKGSPSKVFEALLLAQLTFKTIKQNLFWAFFYNIAAIPLAAFGLLNPIIAAGAMAFSSISVILNSLRIQKKSKLLV